MMEDLGKMTFEERRAFFNQKHKQLEDQESKRAEAEQEKVIKQLENMSSFKGRVRHFFGLDKAELRQSSLNYERSQKQNMLISGIRNYRDWECVYVKAPDGLIYRTNEISLKGKSPEEIKQLQQTLETLYAINTQVTTAGSRQNQDINATEVFIDKHNRYYVTPPQQENEIQEGDTVLRIADPVSNHRLQGYIFRFTQYQRGIEDIYVPLTQAEYASIMESQRERVKEKLLQKQDKAEKAKIMETVQAFIEDPQKRALLVQFLEEQAANTPQNDNGGNSASPTTPKHTQDPRGSGGR